MVPTSPHSSTVTHEEFILFHRVDRELFKILVLRLDREPAESMQVMGMWLWFEKVGFRNLVSKIISLPNILINEIADETVTCLNHVNNTLLLSHPVEGAAADIPLLQSITDKDVTLQSLYESRSAVLEGVARTVQDVCMRAFSDILHQLALAKTVAPPALQNNNKNNNKNNVNKNDVWFGSIGPTRLGAVGRGGEGMTSAEERTMFVTFSKGYRVEEWEVREFLTMTYGDCIEALYMQEVGENEQPLFARIVFRGLSTIDNILRGVSKVKFNINGKHVWIRKFVPKRNKPLLSTTAAAAAPTTFTPPIFKD